MQGVHREGNASSEGRLTEAVFQEHTASRTQVAMDDAQGVEVGDSTAQLPSDVLQAQQPRHRVAVVGVVLRRVEVRTQAPVGVENKVALSLLF